MVHHVQPTGVGARKLRRADRAHEPFPAPESLDYVVVIGGLLHAGPQIDDATTRYLREVAETRIPLIGICTGSFILCRAGLMRGRRSC